MIQNWWQIPGIIKRGNRMNNTNSITMQFSLNDRPRLYLLTMFILVSLIVTIPANEARATADITQVDMQSELPEDNIGIGDLIRYAFEHNPSIEEARATWKMAVEKFRIQTGYPDPKLTVTYFPDPIETRLGPQDWNAAISQKIPFPGKLSKAGKVAEHDANIAQIKLDLAIRNIVVALRESVFELYYIRNAKKIAAQNGKLLEHLRKVTETQYAQDGAALVDVVKAQAQVGQLRYDILLLDDLEVTEITKLNSILNRSPEAPVGSIQFETLPQAVMRLNDIYTLAEQHQEEIKIAAENIKKAQAKVNLARAKNLPDFSLGLFYAAIGEPDVPEPPDESGRDVLGVQAGITIPLWYGKNKSRVNLAHAERRKARAAREKRINATRTRVRTLFFRLENAERIIKLYQQDLIPQANAAVQLSETFFKEGESSFTDFIETQSVLYNFQLALARARADYGKYLVRLEQLVGREIALKGAAPQSNQAGEKS